LYFGGGELRILPEIPGSWWQQPAPGHSPALGQGAVSRCLAKSFCPFAASCLMFTLPNFVPFFVVILQACDGLSAVEGRRVLQAGGERSRR